jgi:hypothetical protein
MDKLLEQQVRTRAGGVCEYCRMPDWLYDQLFHLDHIIARKHRGSSESANLAFCCLDCNAHKGTNIAGLDPTTGMLTRLFNPRTDKWAQHFKWNGPLLEGLSDIGRTTVAVLEINQLIRVRARGVLIAEGVFPPRTVG